MILCRPARIRLVLAVLLGVTAGAAAQPLPNPYQLVDERPNLPAHMNGGRWGETIGVDRDADGNIWVFHRCFNNQPPGAATCVGRDDDPPVVKFSPDGQLLDSWRATSGRPTTTATRRCSACRPAGAGTKSSSSARPARSS